MSAGTNFTFKVYPRMSFKNSYLSKEPENETIGVVVIIAGVTAVFALYDYLSNHRMRALSAFANITSKMVDDVFPRTVKERLMRAKQKEVSQAQEERKASSPSGRGGLIVGLPGTSNAHAGDGAGGPDALGNGGAGAGRNRRGSIGVQIFTGMSGFLSSRLSVSSRNGTPKQRSRDGRFSLQDRPIADHFPSVTARPLPAPHLAAVPVLWLRSLFLSSCVSLLSRLSATPPAKSLALLHHTTSAIHSVCRESNPHAQSSPNHCRCASATSKDSPRGHPLSPLRRCLRCSNNTSACSTRCVRAMPRI